LRTADGYIINKCLNGDKAAFGLLVDKYKEGVYALAYSKLGNFHDAEDVAQEVFVKAYRKLHTLKQYDSFHAWLYATTSNLCKDWIRARARRPDGEYIEDEDPETLEVLSIEDYREKAAQRSLHDSLEEALESLPEMHRQVLTLYYLAGMSGKEIARFLGIAPMTAWRRLSRARSQLRKEMAAMMDAAFEEKRLPGGFTLRIVEAIKRIKIQPVPRTAGLPWGISAAAGILITVLSLNPYVNLTNPSDTAAGSRLPVEAKMLKTGEIPVDVLEISHIPFISGRQGGGQGGIPVGLNAFFLAPRGQAGTWTRKADMPTARWGLSTSVVNGRIYAIGGAVAPQNYTPRVEEYDPVKDEWKEKADMPTRRAFPSTAVVDGKIYAIGGYGGGGIECATVEEYDPVKDEWTKKADMPTPRMFFSTSVVNGRIYAIGGWQAAAVISPSPVEEYDPVADEWTKKPDMPGIAVRELSASAMNERIYTFGGWDGDNFVSTVREYNPMADIWTEKADMPAARYCISTNVVGGKIYAIGSWWWDELSTVQEYDPVKDKWAKKDDIDIAKWGLSTSAVNGKIYIIGGYSEENVLTVALSDVIEYNTGFASKSVEATGKLPTKWGKIK
jgi:RNA polymerase sigma factor (sigma-70 family)